MKLMTKEFDFKRKPVEESGKQSQENECFICGGRDHFASMCPTKNLCLLDGKEADHQEDEYQITLEQEGDVEEVEGLE